MPVTRANRSPDWEKPAGMSMPAGPRDCQCRPADVAGSDCASAAYFRKSATLLLALSAAPTLSRLGASSFSPGLVAAAKTCGTPTTGARDADGALADVARADSP